jgi:hypothetical protein
MPCFYNAFGEYICKDIETFNNPFTNIINQVKNINNQLKTILTKQVKPINSTIRKPKKTTINNTTNTNQVKKFDLFKKNKINDVPKLAMDLTNKLVSPKIDWLKNIYNCSYSTARKMASSIIYDIVLNLLEKNRYNSKNSYNTIINNITNEAFTQLQYIMSGSLGEIRETNNMVAKNGKCGPDNNYKMCPQGQCCSKHGLCGGIIGVGSNFCSNYSSKTWKGRSYGMFDGNINKKGYCGLDNEESWNASFCAKGCCGEDNKCNTNNCIYTKEIKIGNFNGTYDFR